MPKLFRARLRESVDDRMKPAFDELCAWEDDIIEALNLAASAADRMAAALEAIEEAPYGKFESKGDYAAFVRDLARNGRFPK